MTSHLAPVCDRPRMYFGDTPTASIELAAFVNGWMAHRSGFMREGFGMACQADPSKTLEENGQIFMEQILEWHRNRAPGAWRCCVDAPKETPK